MTSVREDLIKALRAYEKEEKRKRAIELAKEATKGFAKGAMGAMYDMANGATFGGIEKLDEKYFNRVMQQTDDEIEKEADRADVGDIYRRLKTFNEGVGAGLGLFGAKNAGGYGLNEAVKFNGRRDLVKQLERGENFRDINFGKMNKDTLSDINKLREQEGYNQLSPQTYIPANVVRKLHEKRLSEGYTPQEVSGIASDLFQRGGRNVTESRYPHIQQVIKPQEKVSDVGYVSQNPSSGQTVIKSVYKKDNEDIIRNLPEGRRDPSSVVHRLEKESAVPARLSALRQTLNNNITPINRDVNEELEEVLKRLSRMRKMF